MLTSKLLPDLAPALFRSKLCAKHSTFLQQYRFARAGQTVIKLPNRGKQRKEDWKAKKTNPPLSQTIRANKGVGRQMALLSEIPGSDEFDDHSDDIIEYAEESLEDDKDFFTTHHDYAEMDREFRQRSRNLSYQITKRKFFKPPKQPNLLTYAEKEQIRFLFTDAENKWSEETLAESYPATPEILKKICRSKWRPLSAQNILYHDAAVKRNWEDFKNGKLTVNDDFQEHLKKFSNRKISVPLLSDAEKFLQKPAKKPRKIDEFTKIIESHRKFRELSPTGSTLASENSADKREIVAKENPKSDPVKNEIMSLDAQMQNIITEDEPTNRWARHFTFDDYRKKLEKKLKRVEDVDIEERRIIKSKNVSNSIPLENSRNNSKFQEIGLTGNISTLENPTNKSEIEAKENSTSREPKTDSFKSESVSLNAPEENIISENEPTNRRARHLTFDEFRKNSETKSKREKDADLEDRQIINSRTENVSNLMRHKKSRQIAEEEGAWKEEIDILDESNTNSSKSVVKNSPPSNARGNLSSKRENSVRTPQEMEPKDENGVSYNPSFLSEMTSVIRRGNELVKKDIELELEEELAIKEFIKIPKHLRKSDCLYKVNDCFYSNDGKFLYRVPGLKS